jgi:hypothetical protein
MSFEENLAFTLCLFSSYLKNLKLHVEFKVRTNDSYFMEVCVNKAREPSMVVYAYNPSIWEARGSYVGGSYVPGSLAYLIRPCPKKPN